MHLHHYIFYFMVGIEVLLLIPFFLHYRLLNKEQRVIFAYAISNAFTGVVADIIARIYHNNMAFTAVMFLVQFFILTLFYIHVLKHPKAKKILQVMLAAAVALFAVDFTFLEGPLLFNSIFISFRTFVLIIYGVIFFLQLMRDESLIEQSIYINTLPAFWFNAGLFVSLCCSFPLDLCFNFLQRGGTPDDKLLSIFRITASLTWTGGVIQAILFYIGLLKVKGVRR
ncbi:hypothetical protein SAMN04488055_1384 [Chitinophaga niabensis]|uniref:YhhN-like protein n=2 Tax=Chitinophaga niabensis TaxID=536979 RepID=A0A1N6E8A2_9BACT|nr:hypothetical protein SAMN04488055_1384 [Chitinophaga niabensis]